MPEPGSTRTRTRRRVLLVTLIWAVVFGFAVVAFALARDYFEVPEARIPSVAGLTLAEATREVRASGLRLRTYPVEAPGTPAEVVVEQSPPAGTLVREGRVVDVGVHVPSESGRMPALVGSAEADAIATLRSVGFPAPDVAYVRTDDGPVGRVVAQTPAPGAALETGERVALEVSRGSRPSDVELPDVSGVEVESALAQLAALGLRSVEAVAVDVSALRPGTVVQQRPEAGTTMAPGEPVTLGYALEGSRVARVPDLSGTDPTFARVSLAAAGLRLGPVEVIRDAERAPGVVETRPSGTTVAGGVVGLVINAPDGAEVDLGPELDGDFGAGRRVDPLGPDDGPDDGPDVPVGPDDVATDPGDEPLPEGARRVPFQFDPAVLGVRSLMEEGYELRLVVRDDEGERVVLEEDVPGGRTVDAEVVVHGDEALLQTYVNGVFFQAWRP